MCIVIYFSLLSTGESFGSFCDTFSFINSSKALLKFDKNNELNSIYGFKVLMMLFVMLIHRLSHLYDNPMINPKRVETVSQANIFETRLLKNY